jgi:hypothetical protein
MATGIGAAPYRRRMRRPLFPAAGLGTLAFMAFALPAGTPTAHPPAPSLQQLLDQAGHALPFDPELASVSCPVERGPVKEGSDADRYKVSTTVYSTTIYSLRGRAKPSSYPRNNRIAPVELHTWAVTAYLTQYKVEGDGDIHLVLKDSSNRSMIAEIPYGSCVPTISRWKSAIASARAIFARSYAATTSWKYTKRSVTLRGLGFFDVLHGQTGVAPNGIELHPVIYVVFH